MSSKSSSGRGRLLRIYVAVTVIIALNGAFFLAWSHYLPQVPLFASKDSAVEEPLAASPEISVVSQISTPPKTGEALVTALLNVTPTPSGGWRVLSGEPENLAPIITQVCTETDPPRSPALQGQKAWAPTGEISLPVSPSPSPSPSPSGSASPSVQPQRSKQAITSGLLQQVSIYPAGVGALAYRGIQNILADCYGGEEWRLSYWTPLAFATESLYAEFSSGADTQGLVLFRFGDVLGVVAGRNYPSLQESAGQWAALWPTVLSDACLNLESTTDDARRQPIIASLYTPYAEERTIQLSSSQKAQIEREEEYPGRQRAIAAFESSSPSPSTPSESTIPDAYSGPATQRLIAPGVTIQLGTEPVSEYGLTVALDAEPERPTAPEYPGKPRGSRTILILAEDLNGPGCGWRLLSQPTPRFDVAAAQQQLITATQQNESVLLNQYRRWIRQTWDYSIKYAEFARLANRWNAWAAISERLVAEADWRHYDGLAEQYEADLDVYETELAIILECEAKRDEAIREIETPSPAPSPSPTVTPAPRPEIPVCEPRPTLPSIPVPPTRARPAGMDAQQIAG